RLALTLAQGGEFAFVLFSAAVGSEVLPQAVVDRLIAVVTLSMVLTPLLLLISDWLGKRSEPDQKPDFDTVDPDETPVIIAGFGRVGQVVARVLQMRGITFTALDRDADHVALVRRWGNKIYYGEPTNLETLRAAQAGKARLLVICMDDVEKSVRAVEIARRHFPHLKIYARARDRHHALHLMELGVDYLIRETWESSLIMAREVLTGLGDNPDSAAYTVEVFNETDQELLKRQLKHRNDLERMIQSSREIRNELQDLFENDPRMSTLKSENKPSENS
ncbi:MAG: NAD-binding protein, partial [Salinisphaeraceae bacterium]|nr:NAD-binding protein [Salinisphaeraceae bacterium]